MSNIFLFIYLFSAIDGEPVKFNIMQLTYDYMSLSLLLQTTRCLCLDVSRPLGVSVSTPSDQWVSLSLLLQTTRCFCLDVSRPLGVFFSFFGVYITLYCTIVQRKSTGQL